jgi:hypothetical protein
LMKATFQLAHRKQGGNFNQAGVPASKSSRPLLAPSSRTITMVSSSSSRPAAWAAALVVVHCLCNHASVEGFASRPGSLFGGRPSSSSLPMVRFPTTCLLSRFDTLGLEDTSAFRPSTRTSSNVILSRPRLLCDRAIRSVEFLSLSSSSASYVPFCFVSTHSAA